MPEFIRAFFEPRFGYDFSKVRIHADNRAVETAQALNARAFIVGRDIVFGAGEYAPKTPQGKRLIAHELTHVVQQATPRKVLVQRTNEEEREEEKIQIVAQPPLITFGSIASAWREHWREEVKEWVRTRMIVHCIWARDGAKNAFDSLWDRFTPSELDLIWEGYAITVFLQPIQMIPVIGSYFRRTLTNGILAGMRAKMVKLNKLKEILMKEIYKEVNENFLIPSDADYARVLSPILLDAQNEFYTACEERKCRPESIKHTRMLKTLVEEKIPDVKGRTEFYKKAILEEMGPRILQGIIHAQILIEDDEIAKKFKQAILEQPMEKWDIETVRQLAIDILHTDWFGNKVLLKKYHISIKPFFEMRKRLKEGTTTGPPK